MAQSDKVQPAVTFTPKYSRINTNSGKRIDMFDTTVSCPPALAKTAKAAGHRYIASEHGTNRTASHNSWNVLYTITRGWGAPGGVAPASPKGYLNKYRPASGASS